MTTSYFDNTRATDKRPISPTTEDTSPLWKKICLQPSDADSVYGVMRSPSVDDSALQFQLTRRVDGLPQDVFHMDLDEKVILEKPAPIDIEEEVPESIDSSSVSSQPDTCLGVVSPKPP